MPGLSSPLDDGRVVRKLDDGVGALGGYADVYEEGVQGRDEHAALRGAGVESQDGDGGAQMFLWVLCLYSLYLSKKGRWTADVQVFYSITLLPLDWVLSAKICLSVPRQSLNEVNQRQSPLDGVTRMK